MSTKIMYNWLGETPDEIYEKLKNEPKVKIKGVYAFCRESDKEYLEEKYGIIFSDYANGLFSMFQDEFALEFDLIDFDMVFRDRIRWNYNVELFDDNFESWIQYHREIYLKELKDIIDSYEEREEEYYNFIEFIADKMNERENANL